MKEIIVVVISALNLLVLAYTTFYLSTKTRAEEKVETLFSRQTDRIIQWGDHESEFWKARIAVEECLGLLASAKMHVDDLTTTQKYILAVFSQRFGYKDKARELYRQLPQEEMNAHMHINYAHVLYEDENWQDVRKHLLLAVKKDELHGEAHNFLGWVLMTHFENYEDAEAHFVKASRTRPNFSAPYENLGYLHCHHLKNYNKARAHYERAIEIEPDHWDARYGIGTLLALHFGEFETARKHYLKAIELNPPEPYFARLHLSLGRLLIEELGETEKGARHLEYAAELGSDEASNYIKT